MSGKPTAVVTGGAGFIGSHMVDLLLARGFRVRVIDSLAAGREANLAQHAANPDLALERADIRGLAPGASLFAGARYLFHFAGIGAVVASIERPIEYLSVNAQGTVQMLECARAAGIGKFVYAASASCYGLAAVPTREDHPIALPHPYALSKYLGEEACLHWHRVYRLPVNSMRIFNAYGPRASLAGIYGAVFGVFLRQKLAGKPYTVVGDGNQTRDFLYVSDVARGFLAAAERGRAGEVYNLGAGREQTINRLVELLGGPKIHLPKRPGEPERSWADISKIRRELGWDPEVGFEDGVGRMLAGIDYWREAPLWDPQSIAKATETWFGTMTPEAGR